MPLTVTPLTEIFYWSTERVHMSKKPQATFSSTRIAATSASPNLTTQVITPNPNLAKKTAIVVIEKDPDSSLIMSVFRKSGSLPGSYSRDIYVKKNKKWVYSRKDDNKYLEPPIPPKNAKNTTVNSVDVWTQKTLTTNEIKEVREVLGI
jgi:hypothetical protein